MVMTACVLCDESLAHLKGLVLDFEVVVGVLLRHAPCEEAKKIVDKVE